MWNVWVRQWKICTIFSKGRNASGDLALFKTRANKVAVATSANDSANFGTEITCGDTDRSITNLFSANDLVYVGREDGLFQYDRGTNKFLDLQPEANLFRMTQTLSQLWADPDQSLQQVVIKLSLR